MQASLFVMLGGALGALGRYQLGRATFHMFGPGLPWGTFFANIAGGLFMGLLVGILARQGGNEQIRLFLAVGMLGGFTTFSSFSLEVVGFVERGSFGLAAGYALASVILSVAALFAGLALTRVAA